MKALIILLLLVLGIVGCAVAQGSQTCNPAAPGLYQKIAVITFDGILPFYSFDGNHFYDEFLNYTQSMKDAFKQEALDLFRTRFGLPDPASDPERLDLKLIQINDKGNQRAVVLTGESDSPASGLRVLNAGWVLTVKDLGGYTLGGDINGTFVGPATTFTVGHWYIVKQWCADMPCGGYIWKTQSASPGLIASTAPGQLGVATIDEFDVSSTRWGEGKAFNMAKYPWYPGEAIFRNFFYF